MRPGVRRIVRVPKPNARDHLLDHLKKIVVGSLPDLTGRQGCRRVGANRTQRPSCIRGSQYIMNGWSHRRLPSPAWLRPARDESSP